MKHEYGIVKISVLIIYNCGKNLFFTYRYLTVLAKIILLRLRPGLPCSIFSSPGPKGQMAAVKKLSLA